MTEEKKSAEAASAPDDASKKSAKDGVSLTEGLGGYLGVKAGMTQIFDKDGSQQAVTVIDLAANCVTDVRTQEKNGYSAVQVGVLEKTKKHRQTKAQMGHAKKAGKAFYSLQEFRMPSNAKLEGVTAGVQLGIDFVKEGDFVDVTAISKGKGFQGVMKRYHFSGGPASHGASIVHRMPGSINVGRTPSKVFPGKKMAGQMGNKRVTTQNVRVVRVDKENNLLLVNGSVPGPKSGIVRIRRSIKKIKDQTFGVSHA